MAVKNSTLAKVVPQLATHRLATFFSYIDTKHGGPTGTCWEWRGASDKNGYGVFDNFKATRLMWRIHNGESPPQDKMICHHCDNPCCVNPEHHFLGTNSDNQLDAYKKGLNVGKKGEENPQCKLSEKDCLKIREMYESRLYTQAAIATIFGIRQPQVSRIVLGKRRGHDAIVISKASITIKINEQNLTVEEAAKLFNLSKHIIYARLKKGWCAACTVNAPVKIGRYNSHVCSHICTHAPTEAQENDPLGIVA